jgi:predicted CoA-binding protein
MTEMRLIRDFLAQKRIAVVGVSRRPKDFSRALFRELQRRGYDAVPVHPDAEEIEDAPCFANIQDVDPPVDAVLFMTPPAVTESLVQDCADAGIKRVWMYRGGGTGAVAPAAVKFCESRGIAVIAGECPFMFLPQTGLVHRIHGLVRKITGSYPKSSPRPAA